MFHLFQRRRRDLLLDSSLEEYSRRRRNGNAPSQSRGSVFGHAVIDCNHKEGHNNLVCDYFFETPIYSDKQFRRRFRMSRDLFMRIHDGVLQYDKYFEQAPNAANKLGLSSLQKVTAAIRMLAYGDSGDRMDEYLQIAESTANEALKRFCEGVNIVFGERYLRRPDSNDISRLLRLHEERGFPGMLGSIDCMHWTWKNCPTAWKGHYRGHYKQPTVVLEAVASRDLWIWHAFFGLPGSLNDINILERSPVFSYLVNGRAPPVNFVINGTQYDMGYYLGDGIYPQWSTIVKTISMPLTEKAQNFAAKQESARKDVERAFGVLQARFHMIVEPCKYFKLSTMQTIMKACIIIHNMIVEEERDLYVSLQNGNYYLDGEYTTRELHKDGGNVDYKTFIEGRRKLKNKTTHRQLQEDLVEHLWERRGNQV